MHGRCNTTTEEKVVRAISQSVSAQTIRKNVPNYGLKAFSLLTTANTTGMAFFGLTVLCILLKDEDSHTPADHSCVEAISNIFSAVTNVDLASILTDG